MGEIVEVLGRYVKFLLIRLFVHLSSGQKDRILEICFGIALLAAIFELLKVTLPWCTRAFSGFRIAVKELTTHPSVRPNLPKPSRASLVLPIVLLIVASTGEWPHNFYVLVRWLVCGTLALALMKLDRTKAMLWLVAIGAAALLFNPIAPFRFDKETWSLLNLSGASAVGIFLLFSRSTGLDAQKVS